MVKYAYYIYKTMPYIGSYTSIVVLKLLHWVSFHCHEYGDYGLLQVNPPYAFHQLLNGLPNPQLNILLKKCIISSYLSNLC